jgi:hypothetical protein
MKGTSVWLYGSQARGDADALSDVDILVAGETSSEELRWLGDVFESQRLSITRYEWSELEHMSSYGSLFLLHLGMEGRPIRPSLSDSTLRRLANTVTPYQHVGKDLLAFRETLTDVRRSLLEDGSAIFEMSVVATVFRHAAVLASYVVGTPSFGRRQSFGVACDGLGFSSVTLKAFSTLYRFRLHESRGLSLPYVPSVDEALKWAGLADEFLNLIEQRANHDA